MDRPGFEFQHVPTFYLFSKYPEPLPDHKVFYFIGTGRFNRGHNGWGVMLTTKFYMKFFQKDETKINWQKKL